MTRAKKQIQREMDLEEAVRIYSSWVERDSKQIHQLKADLDQMAEDEADAFEQLESAEIELDDKDAQIAVLKAEIEEKNKENEKLKADLEQHRTSQFLDLCRLNMGVN